MANHTEYRGQMVPWLRSTLMELRAAEGDVTPELLDYVDGVLNATKLVEAERYIPDEEVAQVYLSGMSLHDTGVHFGMNTTTVRKALLRLGIQPRRQGTPSRARDRRKSANPERVEKMIEMRGRGCTLNEIGTSFGITRERVRQLLTKAGIDTTDEARPLKPKELAAVEDYARNGESLWTVALRHDLKPYTLKSLVMKAGYKVRPSPRFGRISAETKSRAKQAAKLYKDGLGVNDIAERLGYPARKDRGHGGVIYRLLAIAGIIPDRRPRKTTRLEPLGKDSHG